MERPVTEWRPTLLATFCLVAFAVRRLFVGGGEEDDCPRSGSSTADDGEVNIHLNAWMHVRVGCGQNRGGRHLDQEGALPQPILTIV